MESWWIWVGAAVALSLFLTVPIRVGFRVHSNHEGVRVHAVYHFVGPLQGSVRIPSLGSFKKPFRSLKRRSQKAGGERDDSGHDFNVWNRGRWALVVSLLRLAMAIFRQVERFDWTTKVGTGDAAYTSWCTGMLWAAKSGLISFLSRHVTWLSPPRLQVVPDFDHALFLLDVTCIFRFRFGEIIVASISYVFGRLRKGGV